MQISDSTGSIITRKNLQTYVYELRKRIMQLSMNVWTVPKNFQININFLVSKRDVFKVLRKEDFWAILTENVHRVWKTYDFCMLVCCDFMYAHTYAFFWYQTCTSSEHSKIEVRDQCKIKSETSDIWRTSAWFLKTFGERVEENHIYDLVKPNTTVKARTVYRGCNVCYQILLENRKIDFKSKIWNFSIKFFRPKLVFSLNLH